MTDNPMEPAGTAAESIAKFMDEHVSSGSVPQADPMVIFDVDNEGGNQIMLPQSQISSMQDVAPGMVELFVKGEKEPYTVKGAVIDFFTNWRKG